jgi:hypothetical protein
MRPLRDRIRERTRQSGTQQMVIEKDYALSYILAGIAVQPELAQSLVFKGGTALKKLFFGNYRFSEDLDFSTVDAPKGDDLEAAIRRATDFPLNCWTCMDLSLCEWNATRSATRIRAARRHSLFAYSFPGIGNRTAE